MICTEKKRRLARAVCAGELVEVGTDDLLCACLEKIIVIKLEAC